MTSGITSITAASDGEDTAQRQADERTYGLAVLRGREAKALISVAMEALACLETAEHYLLMLGSVVGEQPRTSRPLPGPDL